MTALEIILPRLVLDSGVALERSRAVEKIQASETANDFENLQPKRTKKKKKEIMIDEEELILSTSKTTKQKLETTKENNREMKILPLSNKIYKDSKLNMENHRW